MLNKGLLEEKYGKKRQEKGNSVYIMTKKSHLLTRGRETLNGLDVVRVMVSVSKRYFKRAVKRNRIKRQLREAYRLQKDLLVPLPGGLDIAFLWTSGEMPPTDKVFQKMHNVLQRVRESVAEGRRSDIED